MAITGVMLVVGAFWGRAGGLILVGLIAAIATVGGTASEDLEGTRLAYAPRPWARCATATTSEPVR